MAFLLHFISYFEVEGKNKENIQTASVDVTGHRAISFPSSGGYQDECMTEGPTSQRLGFWPSRQQKR